MKVGYVRVSTVEQSETEALEQQTARVKKAGASLIFSDVESGKSDKRREFNKMLAMCKQGRITEIIITRIDRLARSVITTHKTLTMLEEHKIKLNILDAPIDDIASPFGWFSAGQMAHLAEFESRLLSSRIKHGIAYFREQKKAAYKPPFGYMRVDERYALDTRLHESGKANWQIAVEMIDAYLVEGSTLRSSINFILQKYGIRWTQAGFRYWMTCPTLQGHTAYNLRGNQNHPERWQVHENTHQALISNDKFRLIQAKLQENQTRYCFGNNKKPGQEKLPLVGQIFCGDCGYKCFCLRRYSKLRIRCKQHENLGEVFCKNKVSTYLPNIIEVVDQALIKKHQELAGIAASSIPSSGDSPELTAQHEQLNALQRLPKSPIINDAIKQTLLEIDRIKQSSAIESLINQDLIRLLDRTLGSPTYWEILPTSEKRQIYQELVDSVTVLNGEVLAVRLRI